MREREKSDRERNSDLQRNSDMEEEIEQEPVRSLTVSLSKSNARSQITSAPSQLVPIEMESAESFELDMIIEEHPSKLPID